MRTSALVILNCIAGLVAPRVFAQAPSPPPTLSPDAHIDFAIQPPDATPQPAGPPSGPRQAEVRGRGPEPADLGEAPPVRPRHKGLVLETTLGILAFAGEFRHVAPPAYWTHAQLGYEILSWFMLFGEGELAFTDTSESQDASHSRAVPLWGFGGGARATAHHKDVAAFFQASVGALTAKVPHDALAYLGYRGAESLHAQFGGRAGLEWYARDRHLALCVQGGPRIAEGFSRAILNAGALPLMWDVAAGLRYTF